MTTLSFPHRRFLPDAHGAGLVEMLILIGFVALIALAGFKLLGRGIESKIVEQGAVVEAIPTPLVTAEQAPHHPPFDSGGVVGNHTLETTPPARAPRPRHPPSGTGDVL